MKILRNIPLFLMSATLCYAQPKKLPFEDRFSPDLKPTAEGEARLDAWFKDAKYGAFIHFGVYSKLGGQYKDEIPKGHYSEWIRKNLKMSPEAYHEVAKGFNPVEFDAKEWVKIFKDGGMKYVVITSKHHDGFALFDSAVSDFNVVDYTPFKRDIIKELSEACHAEGLKFGVYYSHAKDWDEPDATDTNLKATRALHPDLPKDFKPNLDSYLEKKSLPQIKELLTNYKIDLLWCDTPHGMTPERAKKVSDLVWSINPDCIINSRILLRANNKIEQEHLKFMDYASLKDKEVPPKPKKPSTIYFESPDSVSTSYGFRKFGEHDYHDENELMARFVHTVCNGGNYLLNNGPMGNGKIDTKAVHLYGIIGEWIKGNGESIYGTRPNPLPTQPSWGDVSVSKDGKTLYLHVLNYPKSGSLSIEGLEGKATAVNFLETGDATEFIQAENKLTITLPSDPVNKLNTVIKVSL